jgi:hypothetical protein
MTFLGELWHIVKKDVRQSRWLLGAFVLLAIAATIGAVSAENIVGGRLQLAALLMIITGPVAAATIVQADSPTRADAFWASKPFRRSAMFAAKLVLLVGVLLLLPLLGQWLGLIAFDVPRDEQWSILLTSAGTYGSVLLIAMFLAALTPELRSFMLAVVACLIAMLAIGIALSGELGSVWGESVMHVVAEVAGLIGVVALFMLLYLRGRVPWTRTLGVVVLALFLTGTLASSELTPRAEVVADAVKVVPGMPAITVEMRDTARIRREGRFHLRITLTGASGNQRYRLDQARARFFLRDGTTTEMPLWAYGPMVLRTGKLDLPGIPTVHEGMARFSGPSMTREQAVLGDVRRALLGGIDSVRVTGKLILVQPHVFAMLPLRRGATVLRDGQSTRITALGLDAANDILRLSTKTVGRSSGSQDWSNNGIGTTTYLVNEQRHEAVALQAMSGGYSPGLLVLPGAGVRQGTNSYRAPNEDEIDMPLLDAAWLRDASLMLISWDDGPGVPVSASSVPLPPAAGMNRGSSVVTSSAPVTSWPFR